jgi:hypothetical protein
MPVTDSMVIASPMLGLLAIGAPRPVTSVTKVASNGQPREKTLPIDSAGGTKSWDY